MRLAVPMPTLLTLLGTASIQTVPIPFTALTDSAARTGVVHTPISTQGSSRHLDARTDGRTATARRVVATRGGSRHGCVGRSPTDLLDKPQLDLGYRLVVSDLELAHA